MKEVHLSDFENFPGSMLTQEGSSTELAQKIYEVEADPQEVIKFYIDQIKKLTGKSEEEIKSVFEAVNIIDNEGQYILGVGDIMIQIGTEGVNGKTTYMLTEKTT